VTYIAAIKGVDQTMNNASSESCKPLDDASRQSCSEDQVTADSGVIEIHVQNLSYLFDAMDPSPPFGKDLNPNVVEYILGSVKELSSRAPSAIVLYLDQLPGDPEEARMVENATRNHFARHSQLLRWKLRDLIQRGWISLGIGLVFLAAVFSMAQFVVWLMGERTLAHLIREGLIIFGWVAMWRPLEIFLYDWWPIVGERRVHDRLSQVKVRIVYTDRKPQRPFTFAENSQRS
jgi:hypothetical protein